MTETDPGTTWTYQVTGSPVTVPPDGTGTASVTNTRKLGSLEVTKVVNWNGITPVADASRSASAALLGSPSCKTFTYPS